MKETIICAAIWYKELPTQKFKATNQDKGIIICGHRHGHCIDIMYSLTQKRTVTFAEDGVGEHEQGFLTNRNRFLNRRDAFELALKNGQIDGGKLNGQLYSEDLY